MNNYCFSLDAKLKKFFYKCDRVRIGYFRLTFHGILCVIIGCLFIVIWHYLCELCNFAKQKY